MTVVLLTLCARLLELLVCIFAAVLVHNRSLVLSLSVVVLLGTVTDRIFESKPYSEIGAW